MIHGRPIGCNSMLYMAQREAEKHVRSMCMATGRSETLLIQGICRVDCGPEAGEAAVELPRVAGVECAGATAGGQHRAVGSGGQRQARAACAQRVYV